MSFQKEFEQRLRRVCGVSDDSLKVIFYEHLSDSNWSGYADDTDFGATYEIEVVVYEVEYSNKRLASKKFTGTAEMIRALEQVEL